MNRKTLLKVKLALLIALGLYVAAFIGVNSLTIAEVWLLPFYSPQVSIAVVIGVTMVVTFLLTWFGRQLIRTIRDLRSSDKPAADEKVSQQDQG